MRIYTSLAAVLLLGVLGATSASAAFSVQTGNIPFTGNQLGEFYFDVDFGGTAHTEAWDVSLTWSTNAGVEVSMFDCDRASIAANDTQWQAAAPFVGTTVPVAGAGSGTLPGWYNTPSYSGVHRFFFTVAPADLAAGTFPCDVTVTITNNAAAATVPGGIQFHMWTTQNATAIGTSGASDGFHRNYLQQNFGIATLGGVNDEIQFEMTAFFPGTPETTDVSLRVLSDVGTTGSVDFDFYDMSASGGQTPEFTLSVGAGGIDVDTHTTAALANAQKFRIVMRAGSGFAPSTLINYWLTFSGNVQIGDFLLTDPLPQQATPVVSISPAGSTLTSSPATLTATGGSGSPSTYNWSIVGTPPTGVSISAATGASTNLIFGSSTPANAMVTIRAANGNTGEFDEETYTLDFGGGGGGGTLTIVSPNSLPNGSETVTYATTTITATQSSAPGPYTWSVSSGTLPPGLVLDTASTALTTTISGTPTTAGNYSFDVQITNGSASDTQAYTVDISAAGTLTITTGATLTSGTESQAYSVNITCTTTTGPYTWSLISGTLPTGVTLGTSTANTVALSGTPAAGTAATYNFTIQVDDSAAGTDTQAFTLTIAPAGGGGPGGGVSGGGGGGGGCAADAGNSHWLALVGLLAMLGVVGALRVRNS